MTEERQKDAVPGPQHRPGERSGSRACLGVPPAQHQAGTEPSGCWQAAEGRHRAPETRPAARARASRHAAAFCAGGEGQGSSAPTQTRLLILASTHSHSD